LGSKQTVTGNISAMPRQTSKPATTGANVLWFLAELAVYALFILAYYFAVLHFCRGWLKTLFDEHKALYAVTALGLMVGQAAVLEVVTAGLRWLTGRAKK
jgi:hypothetical protein